MTTSRLSSLGLWAAMCVFPSAAIAAAQPRPSSPAVAAVSPAVPAPSPADASAAWRAGNEAFAKGQFAQAVESYLAALKLEGNRASATGHYNLGTAYFRLGRMGEAILHFEKALSRAPRHDDAKHNLAIARRTLELDKAMQELAIPAEGFWKRFGRSFTIGEAALVFLVFYYLLFSALIARRFFDGTARAALTIAAIVTAVLTSAGGGVFAHRLYSAERVQQGILLQPKTALMEPHKGEWKSVRTLPQGLRVRIESRNESWVKVRVPNGLVGFVKKEQIGEI